MTVLDVIGLVRLPQQHGRGPVRCEVEIGEELRVTGCHHAVGEQPAGVAVVGMEPVAPPGVVPEYHLGSNTPDHRTHLPPFLHTGLEFAVGLGPGT